MVGNPQREKPFYEMERHLLSSITSIRRYPELFAFDFNLAIKMLFLTTIAFFPAAFK